MKVILQVDISKLGKRNDVVEVKDAYAINVLIPSKKAVQATKAELEKLKALKQAKEYKKIIETNSFMKALDELSKVNIVITKNKDKTGHLFGSVSPDDIVDAIFKSIGISLNPKQVKLDSHIKTVGEHKIQLSDGKNSGVINLTVK